MITAHTSGISRTDENRIARGVDFGIRRGIAVGQWIPSHRMGSVTLGIALQDGIVTGLAVPIFGEHDVGDIAARELDAVDTSGHISGSIGGLPLADNHGVVTACTSVDRLDIAIAQSHRSAGIKACDFKVVFSSTSVHGCVGNGQAHIFGQDTRIAGHDIGCIRTQQWRNPLVFDTYASPALIARAFVLDFVDQDLPYMASVDRVVGDDVAEAVVNDQLIRGIGIELPFEHHGRCDESFTNGIDRNIDQVVANHIDIFLSDKMERQCVHTHFTNCQ